MSKKPQTPAAPDKPQLPASGGSYVVGPDGRPERREGTIGPLDPEHPDQQQPVVEAPVKDA